MVRRSTSAETKAFDTNATRQALAKFKHPSQLWRGYTALAARNLPFTAMQFPMYEALKKWAVERRKERGIFSGTLLEKGLITAVAAGSAGSLAAVVTTPVDVVKTRIMLSAASEDSGASKEAKEAAQQVKSRGIHATEVERSQQAARAGRAGGIAVGREILRTEGMKGLFRGSLLRGGWTALGSGLYLGIYESGRTYLEGRRTGMRDGVPVV
ncbi:MAG: hypothetical protein MMC23_003858 [Stictis urceolatum]|nr:hypothetical protein [Stictis urceolata]